jgi:hypothetical protein
MVRVTNLTPGGGQPYASAGREVTVHTDYTLHGDEFNIAMSYKKLPEDVKPGAEVREKQEFLERECFGFLAKEMFHFPFPRFPSRQLKTKP